MKHQVHHGLGKAPAKKAALAAFEAYRARFGKYQPTAEWVSDDKANISFTAKGMTLKGTLEVNDQTIDMDLEVPFFLRPFKGQALGVIEGEINKWVGKVRSGEI